MIETFIAYGYNLGGPGHWNLDGVTAGGSLRTPWYWDAVTLHDFASLATAQILTGGQVLDRKTLVNKGFRQSAGLAEIDDRARVRRGGVT